MSALDSNPANKNFLSPLNFSFRIKKAPYTNFFIQKVNVPRMFLPEVTVPMVKVVPVTEQPVAVKPLVLPCPMEN